MPYARTNYTLQEIKLGFRKLDTNVTQGNDPATGVPNTQPKPHADIHGADELHSHPLFAKARVTAGDGPGTHSVMDETVMQTELVAVFNDANMQQFLVNVDAGNDAGINVNLTASPGAADVYKANKGAPGATVTNAAVVAFFLKVRPNPSNKDVPIIQTCVPMTVPYTAGQLVTKKGVVKGFTH
jgi:hypothetical protein